MKETIESLTVLACAVVSFVLTTIYTLCLCWAAWNAAGDWPWYAKAPGLLLVAPLAAALGHGLSYLTVVPIALTGNALAYLAEKLSRGAR